MDRKKCRRIVKKVSRLLLVRIAEVLEKEIAREKKVWARKWLARRSTHGGSALLLKELYAEDPAEYRACLRMSPECFGTLHDLIANAIQRSDTLMRDAIPSRIKLEVTWSFLATENSYRNLQHLFWGSKPAISKFIPEVCDSIYRKLGEHINVRNICNLFFIH
jgi:hypothetical protein